MKRNFITVDSLKWNGGVTVSNTIEMLNIQIACKLARIDAIKCFSSNYDRIIIVPIEEAELKVLQSELKALTPKSPKRYFFVHQLKRVTRLELIRRCDSMRGAKNMLQSKVMDIDCICSGEEIQNMRNHGTLTINKGY